MKHITLILLTALFLTACGGGGGGGSRNQEPTVSAGPDQSVDEGASVTLSGTATDSDGTIASTVWAQTAGTSVTLTGATTLSASFTAPTTNTSEQLSFTLTATDDGGATSVDTVVITVNTTNVAPTAEAGAAQTVDEGATVNLDGSASSDSDGTISAFAWSQVSGPAITITNATSAAASFTAPGVSSNTDVVVQLTVTDDREATATDTVTIAVQPVAGLNDSPVANAGADATSSSGQTVTLDGSTSNDPDGTIASFAWVQTAGNAVTLAGANTASASFTAPVVTADETFSFDLTVTDNEGATDTDSVTITVQPQPTTVTVSGKITYDNVPHNAATSGLDYNSITQDPVRGATVEVRQGNTVFSTGVTDDNGDYSLDAPVNSIVVVRVKAESVQAGQPGWDMRVVDNTNIQALYVLDSGNVPTAVSDVTQNLNAPSGWTGTGYGAARSAAPFHILDRMYDSVQKFVAVDNAIVFPELELNWSVNNVLGGTGVTLANLRSGQLGTSFYVRLGATFAEFEGSQIFILGQANSDTDEYDGHIIVHEWGHYFEDRISRSDSIGGQHSAGDRLDMRVAFGEGYGNALSGMITDDPVYRDSSGANQSAGFQINVESNANNPPGWYNEGSVQSILYDLYDGDVDAGDTIELGLAPLYDVLTGSQRTTRAHTSIFTFITALKAENAGAVAGIDALVTNQAIVAGSINEFGSTETNNAGNANVLPIYTTLTAGAAAQQICTTTTLDGAANNPGNRLSNYRYLRFDIASAGSYTVRLTQNNTNDLDLIVYDAGTPVISEQAVTNGDVDGTGTLQPGTYIADTVAYDPSGANIISACYNVQLIQN